MADTSLTDAEKAKKRQELMCGRWAQPTSSGPGGKENNAKAQSEHCAGARDVLGAREIVLAALRPWAEMEMKKLASRQLGRAKPNDVGATLMPCVLDAPLSVILR